MRESNERQLIVNLVIAALLAGVFVWDALTRLGIAEWIFYLAPIGVCLFQQRAWFPLLVACIATLLTLVGFVVSAEGIDPQIAGINRAMGIVIIWLAAVLVRQTLITRAAAGLLSWLAEGQAHIAKSVLGDLQPEAAARALLASLCGYVGARIGALYRIEGDTLLRIAGFALGGAPEDAPSFKLGQGLVGQAAASGTMAVLETLPPDYLRIISATGAGTPQSLVIAPITADGTMVGVVELGFTGKLETDQVTRLLTRVAGDLGIAMRSALHHQRLMELLEETQRQSEELQTQQEELRVANEELEQQSSALRDSQARLENQQAELEQTNAHLEAQTTDLERQKQELLAAQGRLEASAAELEHASRYKSEFLANMSHELRTPLNSSLIMAKLLADNKPGNLSDEQVSHAKVIRSANNDLLALINDILDLSKIESGHVEIQPEPVQLQALLESVRLDFEAIAREQKLRFDIEASPHAPQSLTTDPQRLQQILRNLLSNAFKFTAAGKVELRVAATPGGEVSFSVEDTGIGIPEAQREIIFDAFQQADGTTSRKYGGTGLGLTISRELAGLLGGAIQVQSTQGVGSVFTLTIPAVLEQQTVQGASPAPVPNDVRPAPRDPRQPQQPREPGHEPAHAAHIDDDRSARTRERLILAVEDDMQFARILCELAHELDFDCIHTASGAEALALARSFAPSAILLDVGLPDDSGLSVLDRLKHDPQTRHIPVHMISVDDHTQSALELGAIGYTLKPAAREQLVAAIDSLKARIESRRRKILVVEDDETLRQNIVLLLQADDVQINAAGSVGEALDLLAANAFDCMVMDLALPDATGFDLLERIAQGGKYASPPVIIYTGRTLAPEEEQRLRRYSRSIIIKGARSPERLLDEVTLFLHRVESTLPPDHQKLLRQARQRDTAFEGRTLLLAEDDVRNIYALSSVIEPLGASLKIARNGREALERLKDGQHIDLVLMDVMMPEMDGLTAMREIRKSPELAKLPIIALTAKAMPEDRRACLDAGANDYIAKPIDVDKLLSLCRVWMRK